MPFFQLCIIFMFMYIHDIYTINKLGNSIIYYQHTEQFTCAETNHFLTYWYNIYIFLNIKYKPMPNSSYNLFLHIHIIPWANLQTTMRILDTRPVLYTFAPYITKLIWAIYIVINFQLFGKNLLLPCSCGLVAYWERYNCWLKSIIN